MFRGVNSIRVVVPVGAGVMVRIPWWTRGSVLRSIAWKWKWWLEVVSAVEGDWW